MSRKLYTTVEVAKAAGVPRATLQHWIKTKRILAPAVKLVGGKGTRLWSGAKIAQVRKLKGTLRPGSKKNTGARRRTKTC